MEMEETLREIEQRAARGSDIASDSPLVNRGGNPFGYDVDGPNRTNLAGERGMFLREEDALLFAHAKRDLLFLVKASEKLAILAEGCSRHPSYRAKRKVNTICPRCNEMWEARQSLSELYKESGPSPA